jgi:hypothetical protein
VTLDTPSTVGTLVFDSAQAFTIAGTETLTFDDEGVAATLHVESGSHVISTPVALPVDGILTTIEDPASTLTLSGIVSGDGGIAKSGGNLILTADNSYFGSTSNGSSLQPVQ